MEATAGIGLFALVHRGLQMRQSRNYSFVDDIGDLLHEACVVLVYEDWGEETFMTLGVVLADVESMVGFVDSVVGKVRKSVG